MKKLFLTVFYVGLLKPAPGTWGTIAGAFISFFILRNLGALSLFLIAILIFIVSIFIIDKYEKETQTHDSSIIVIDEVVGVWIAISISLYTVQYWMTSFQYLENPPMWMMDMKWMAILQWAPIFLSIIFFRVFDIWKPSVISKIDKNIKGGLGVMLDDVVAGIVAAIASLICTGIALKIAM